MHRYRNLDGSSGVAAYEIEPEAITLRFRGGATYRYTYAATGRSEVEAMKALAAAGRGLSTFVSREVGKRYARKLA
jgi:hypothetical protein